LAALVVAVLITKMIRVVLAAPVLLAETEVLAKEAAALLA
jgi:hypothetical protein